MKQTSYPRHTQGFTLIEILVTVFIIALISTLVVASFANVRLKSRDTKRVSHLNTIHQALQQYYNDHQYYPATLTFDQPLRNSDNSKVYLDSVPVNPTPRTDHNCPDNEYTYVVSADKKTYSLSVCVGASDPNKSQLLFSEPDGIFHCGDKLADRDGYEYSTVSIGNQCWMSQNLRTKTYPNGLCINGSTAPCSDASIADNGKNRSCYDNLESNCAANGAMYTWYGTMNINGDPNNIGLSKPFPNPYTVWLNHQGVCPDGWRIPTPDDFTNLARAACATGNDNCSIYTYGSSPDWSYVGTYEANVLNSNSFGFNWGYSGQRSGIADIPPDSFSGSGQFGFFWGAGFNGIISNQAFRTLIVAGNPGVERRHTYRFRSYPVRCVKN
jgi:uncharacterized protein (TIGR02145 family)/prepilin-type N-terminal cleavage/methylation domain-containing protein